MTISSKKDFIYKSMKEIKSLSGRIKNKRCLVEGTLLVERALQLGIPIDYIVTTSHNTVTKNSNTVTKNSDREDKSKEIIRLAVEKKVPVYEMTQGLLSGVTDSHPTPNIVASIQVMEQSISDFCFSSDTSALIIDSISNPDNLGMILRTADASGVDAVILIGDSVHYLNRNVVRGARGAIGRLPIFICDNKQEIEFLRLLKENGFQIIGMSARAENENFFDLKYMRKVAFIVGNESYGIREEILQQTSEQVRIPMASGQSSLNVAISAGLVLYELVRAKCIDGRTKD